MVAISLNLTEKVNPVIWSVEHLPFDCSQVLPIPKPIGEFWKILNFYFFAIGTDWLCHRMFFYKAANLTKYLPDHFRRHTFICHQFVVIPESECTCIWCVPQLNCKEIVFFPIT